jgi:ABC-type branched-subunit amino acid transport system substrate-binding protein
MAKNATIGMICDFDMGPATQTMADAIASGVADSAFTGEAKIISASPNGLPMGSEHEFRQGMRELIDAGCLCIVGPAMTENGFIVRDMAMEFKIPAVIWAAHERLRSDWSFHFQLGSLEEEPPVLLRYLIEKGIRRASLVYDDINIILQYADYLEVARRIHGIEIVARQAMIPEIEDARATIAAVAVPQAEALIYLGMGPSAVPVAKALAANGWNVPVVSCSSLSMGKGRPEMARHWGGWIYCDMEDDANPRLIEAKRRLAPDICASPVGISFYDIGRLVGEALDRALYRTRASLREGFEKVKQLPATVGYPGTHMTLGYHDRAVLKGPFLVLREYRDGKSVPLGG